MKGLFTQGAALLLDRVVTLDELLPLLQEFAEPRRLSASGNWTLGGETLLLAFGSERGQVAIDVVERPWPDEMGDPQVSPELFAAWSNGHFGPYTFPHGFERAARQAWIWKEAQAAPPQHQAFLRLRTSYVFGAQPGDPVQPENASPLAELQALTAVARSLSRHPAVVAYFNASGETLLPPARLAEALDWAEKESVPPLDVWSNVRFLNLEGLADGWFLMDTVGMLQLDVPDHEIFLPGKTYDFREAEGFLRNVALYVMNHGPVFADGDTIDGPGGKNWVATSYPEGFTAPPRPVIRWFAEDANPPELLSQPSRDPVN